jgi:hypothetical protein
MGKQIVEGTIEKLSVKELPEPDNYGNSYAVSANIGGSWYSLGRKKKPSANVKNGQNWHQLSEGDQIEAVCNVVEKGDRVYYNIRASDVQLKQAGSGNGGNSNGSNSSAGVRAVSGNSNAPVKGNDDRQAAIMRQSAMGYAASIVAGTLTSKSNLDEAAAEVVRIASEYFVPYAEHGVTSDETRKQEENELKNQQAAQQADEEDFDDAIPF